jgi:hypothetical protein
LRQDFVYESTGKTFVKYERAQECHSLIPDGSTASWLANIYCQAEPDREEISELVYTEEIGLFFKALYISLFSLNEQIKDFVTPDKLKVLIEHHQQLQLTPFSQ